MSKALMWLFIGIGGAIGGYIPVWLGASYFSVWGMLGSLVGGVAGIYIFNQMDL